MTKKLFAAALAAGVLAYPALASEGGGGVYPNGGEGWMAGAVPPPGTYLINYAAYYTANELPGTPVGKNIDLDVYVDALRLIHVTPFQILGGYWGGHVILPFMKMDVDLMGMSDSKTGIGDLTVSPFILSWHAPDAHWVFALDFNVPIGNYDKNDLANLGRNYWNIEPVFAVTWFPTKELELSAKFMYDFNFENPATDYKTGQEFHVDYTVGWHFSDNFAAGIGGYWYQQTTNDELNGVELPNSKGRVYAIGPQIKYDYQGMSFIGKWQHEFGADQKPEGDKFWFKFITAL